MPSKWWRSGLTFPTGITFDGEGAPVVVESGYSYGEVFTEPRLVRIEPDGTTRVLARGDRDGPWTGVTFHGGDFYVAAGDVRGTGKILRINAAGERSTVIDGLPSRGDHHTNGPVMGPDGWLYFGQGVATNSGVVGVDNAQFGWLSRYPEFHDIPGRDITLAGINFKSVNPFATGGNEVVTGAYLPFGTPSQPGQVIKGRVKCGGSVLRVRPEGGEPELVAWGFRNPFGLAFSAGGKLFVTENGFDDRGSRPVWGTPDFLWEIEPGAWYGWPDFVGGEPITEISFARPESPRCNSSSPTIPVSRQSRRPFSRCTPRPMVSTFRAATRLGMSAKRSWRCSATRRQRWARCWRPSAAAWSA